MLNILEKCLATAKPPERYAAHKLIVYGERPVAERAKARKDLLQAASLADYFIRNKQEKTFNAAWRDALSRGKGWRTRALEGKAALLTVAPDIDLPSMWKA